MGENDQSAAPGQTSRSGDGAADRSVPAARHFPDASGEAPLSAVTPVSSVITVLGRPPVAPAAAEATAATVLGAAPGAATAATAATVVGSAATAATAVTTVGEGARTAPTLIAAAGALRPAATDGLLGRTIGGCTIGALLGRGGMGAVYRATQLSLSRAVALKVLLPDHGNDPQFLERFEREARLVASLNHPNVVQVYDAGSDAAAGNMLYMVMEYVAGKTLGEVIKRQGPLAVPMVLEILRQAGEGLAAAHHTGLVHRDIKPDNLMVDAGCRVKVMDFGLARPATAGDASLTASGMILGTPNYISPEAARGEPTDIRSDLYSLGVAAWQAIAGRLPFSAPTPVQVMVQHLEMPPPDLVTVSRCPAEVSALVTRLLAKEPAGRFADPVELVTAVEDLQTRLCGGPVRLAWSAERLVTTSQLVEASVPAQRHTWLVLAAAAAAAGLIGFSAWKMLASDGPVAPASPPSLTSAPDHAPAGSDAARPGVPAAPGPAPAPIASAASPSSSAPAVPPTSIGALAADPSAFPAVPSAVVVPVDLPGTLPAEVPARPPAAVHAAPPASPSAPAAPSTPVPSPAVPKDPPAAAAVAADPLPAPSAIAVAPSAAPEPGPQSPTQPVTPPAAAPAPVPALPVPVPALPVPVPAAPPPIPAPAAPPAAPLVALVPAPDAAPLQPVLVSRLPAGLSVVSVPAGAEVWVDGIRRGTTPLLLRDLASGPHRVRLVKPGAIDESQTVTLSAGTVTRLSNPLPRPAQLELQGVPAGATVLVGGRPYQPGMPIVEGEHEILVGAADGAVRRGTLHAHPGNNVFALPAAAP